MPRTTNEESIFAAALGLASDDERRAFLDEACGDDRALRRNVEQLLEAQRAAGSFLKHPPREVLEMRDAPNGSAPAAEEPGDQATRDLPSAGEGAGAVIGPYRLVERIGEGGFGVVYLARQQQPVRREVALKIIKPGMNMCASMRSRGRIVD